MKRFITIRRAIAILMIAAFVAVPGLPPAMARAQSDVSVSAPDYMAMAMADGMDRDMPCCPSKAPQPVDCDNCLLMAACMTKCFAVHSDASLEPAFRVEASLLPPQNDFWPEGFGHPPPDHPPRTLI